MADRRREDLSWGVTIVVAAMALVLGIVGVVLGAGDRGGGSAAAAAPGGAASAPTSVDVTLADITMSPASIEVPAGAKVTFHVKNSGALQHDFKLADGTGTGMIDPGKTADLAVGPLSADTEAWCSVPGHKEAGMKMTIHVTGGSSTATPAAASSSGMNMGAGMGMTPTTVAATDAKLDATAMPSAGWTARSPILPPATSGTVHEIKMDAVEKEIEVAPGVTQLMWTFDGQVPGPILRGKVGDTFKITLTNKGTMGHSIDFHASKVAWSDEMRTIKPGESLEYDFTADYAGAFMYHCGTAPALHHIGNGMYGAIIIDPPDLAPVDQEFAILQSELYLGPQGQPGDLTKMMNGQFDAVVFNGYVNQYKFAPIHVEQGKRYRVWVVDDGPNENSAFHVVGTVFDTVFKEGAYTLQPDASHGGSQVLDLQPAQGGFVEMSFAEDGLYPFVTHKFANPGKGALGFFAVGDVDTSALGSH